MNEPNNYYTPQKRERVIFIGNRKGPKNYTRSQYCNRRSI